MTDSSQLMPNGNTAVSSDCLFNLKPISVSGRTYRASIPTSNKATFNPGDTAILYIPSRRNCFLDPTQSYIKYTIQNWDTTNDTSIDNTGACVINRLDTFSGSNLLETVQQYNVLYNYMADFQMNLGARYGASSMYGSGITTTVVNIRQGANISKASGASAPTKLTVCMPVLSAVFGLGADKFLPLTALADDIRIEISFEQADMGMVYSSASSTSSARTAWQVAGMELELCIIELSDQGMGIVNSVTPFNQPIFLHGNGFRHYVSTLPVSSSGTYSTLVPARFASLKTLICLPRRSAETSGSTTMPFSYSLSSRANPNFATYWWRIGPYLIPNKPVTLSNTSNTVGGYAEAYMEVIRSFHALSHVDVGGTISFEEYNVADTADTTIASGVAGALGVAPISGNLLSNSSKNAFAIAQELELWANRNDVLVSGMNTLSSQVFFEANINTAIGSTYSYTLDFYEFYNS